LNNTNLNVKNITEKKKPAAESDRNAYFSIPFLFPVSAATAKLPLLPLVGF